MANRLQIRRATLSEIPTLLVGELFLATDTGDCYVGTATGNILLGAVAGLTSGQVLFGAADGHIDQDAGLHWDTSNQRLGIGTTSPSTYLEVLADTAYSATYGGILLAASHTSNAPGLVLGTDSSENIAYIQGENYNVDFNRAIILQPNGGKVGIGTASPDSKLDLRDGSFTMSDADVSQPATGVWAATAYGRMESLSGTAGGLQITGLSDTDATGMYLYGMIGSSNPTDSTPAIIIDGIKYDGGTSVTALGATETVLKVGNAGTSLMTVLGSGYVGIGTATPSCALQVEGSGDISALINSTGTVNSTTLTLQNGNGTTAANYSYFRILNNDSTPMEWRLGTYGSDDLTIRDATAGATRLTVKSSTGYIGAGTDAPDCRMHIMAASAGSVSAPGYSQICIENSGDAYLSFLVGNTSSTGGMIVGSSSDNDRAYMMFSTNSNVCAWLMQGGCAAATTGTWTAEQGDASYGVQHKYFQGTLTDDGIIQVLYVGSGQVKCGTLMVTAYATDDDGLLGTGKFHISAIGETAASVTADDIHGYSALASSVPTALCCYLSGGYVVIENRLGETARLVVSMEYHVCNKN